MTEKEKDEPSAGDPMVTILEQLLAEDADITARAVARLHPSLTAASSITRNPARVALLSKYQERQAEYRRWRGRAARMSGADKSAALAAKDARIAELEEAVQLLTASHVAMLRAVGEIGGFGKWMKFYENYSSVRDRLNELDALPSPNIHELTHTAPPTSQGES